MDELRHVLGIESLSNAVSPLGAMDSSLVQHFQGRLPPLGLLLQALMWHCRCNVALQLDALDLSCTSGACCADVAL